MSTVRIGVLLFAALVSLSAAPPPATQDCYISGPHVNNTPGGPMFTDQGSLGGTGSAGCDGCFVALHRFSVTWPAAEQVHLFGFGTDQHFRVSTDEVTNHTFTGFGSDKNSPRYLTCGGEKNWYANSSYGQSTMSWSCSSCF